MDTQVKDAYYALREDRLRNYLSTIFNRVYLHPKTTKGSYTDSDYSRAERYTTGAAEAIKTAYDEVYAHTVEALKAKPELDSVAQEEYLTSKWNQWIDTFMTVYTHFDRSSGGWSSSDVSGAKRYADGSLAFVDLLNTLVPPTEPTPLDQLGL